MAILMTGLCEKGVDLIWKQCNEELFPQGLEYLKEAMRSGDPEALFFLGHCYSWGDAAVGFNDKKAYDCYREGAKAGSYRCVLGAARSGQYDEEMRAEAKYSLEESYQAVRMAAERGEPFAAYQLGTAFEWENIFSILSEEEKRVEDCLFWYEKAAEGGIVAAMVKAGKCYLNGRFTAKDMEKAIFYADQSASCGSAWGLCQMGLHHMEGGSQDAAFAYFHAASLQGDAVSPYHLGRMYLEGRGTERDIAKAVESFELAASREEKKSLAELGDIFYQDEVVERDDERAFYWYGLAYAAGEKRVALPLALLYLRPSQVRDYQKAKKLLEEAAIDEKDGAAHLVLGNIYREGVDEETDMEKAVSYYRDGAAMGNAECMEILGALYFQGDEVEADYKEAFLWLDKAYRAGTLQSFSKLAFLYLKGYGCEANEERALELFERAVECECDGYAYYELGYIYERRGDTNENLAMAVEYYQKAIEMGNESAKRRFSHFKKNLFGRWKVIY